MLWARSSLTNILNNVSEQTWKTQCNLEQQPGFNLSRYCFNPMVILDFSLCCYWLKGLGCCSALHLALHILTVGSVCFKISFSCVSLEGKPNVVLICPLKRGFCCLSLLLMLILKFTASNTFYVHSVFHYSSSNNTPFGGELRISVVVEVISFLSLAQQFKVFRMLYFYCTMGQMFYIGDRYDMQPAQFCTWTLVLCAQGFLTLPCLNKKGLHWKRFCRDCSIR